MTTYTLMSGQTVATNAPNGPPPTPVTISGSPSRARVTFSIAGPASVFAEASLWAQTALTPYNYTQDIQLAVLNINKGDPNSITQDLPLNMAYYNFLYAQLNVIDRSQRVAASMTLTV
jgi:hypothetical protein